MASYSFDVVSDFDRQELVNTLDQARRDVSQRYDLKDSGTEIELEETAVVITTASDMTLQAVEDIIRAKATKRHLSLKIFDFQSAETVGGNRVQQTVKLKKGLSQELAKKMRVYKFQINQGSTVYPLCPLKTHLRLISARWVCSKIYS